MKILCLCPIGIGNYLLAWPSFRLLRDAMPEAEIHLLALRHSIVDLAQYDPLWDKIHAIDPTRDTGLRRQAGIISALSREHFDASLSFFPANNWQSNLFPFLCGVKKRFAFRYPLRQGASLSFLNTRFLPVDPALHDVDQNLRFAAVYSGAKPPAGPPAFPPLFTEEEWLAGLRLLDGMGGPERVIGIHPGSSGEHGMAAKRWDPMRFGELGLRICKELGANALIFGSPDEESLKSITLSIMKEPHRVIAPCSLRLTAALIRQCSLLLCNDSGLMHIAACMGVPTVALFGPTDERRNGPVGDGNLVIRHAMEGFPLWTAHNVGVREVTRAIDPSASLKALSVDEAWEKVLPWLGRFEEGNK
jgi:ADP-heptose:LPS heptosyltransferase